MLTVTQRIHQLETDLAKTAADSLKGALVWMQKYLAPNIEYWDWPTQDYQISEDTYVTVAFIGLGWVIGLQRELEPKAAHLASIEQQLIDQLADLTKEVPAEAQLRLSVVPWTPASLDALQSTLTPLGAECRVDGLKMTIRIDDSTFKLDFETETLKCEMLDRRSETSLREVLSQIKRFGSKEFSGADWCAFKRRRLTTVTFTADEAAYFADPNLQMDPQRLYESKTEHTTSRLLVQEGGDTICVGKIGFPQAPYHLGITNPRLFLELDTSNLDVVRLTRDDLTTYLSYRWVSHYTSLWEYLVFEDLYTHIDDMRASQSDSDITTESYYRKYRQLSALRAEIEFLNRLEKGKVKSYVPPTLAISTSYIHGTPESNESGILEWLQNRLIPATVTRLNTDPLSGAIPALRLEESRLENTLSAASQAAGLRMQRTLQALQFAFLLAAAAQLLSLIPLGPFLDELLRRTALGAELTSVGERLGFQTDLSAGLTNLVLMGITTYALLKLANSRIIRRASDAT